MAALFGKGDIRARMKERERGTLPLGEREAVSAIPPPPSFLRGKKGKRGAEGTECGTRSEKKSRRGRGKKRDRTAIASQWSGGEGKKSFS